jgi:hypothetical protein
MQIPAPNDFGLVFNSTSCTTGTGLQGIKNVATPVDVTVRNLPLGCEDTLNQTLVYLPEDQTCVVAPDLQLTTPSFPTVPAGTCSPPQLLTINNGGAGTLEIQTLFLQGQFFFQAGSNQNAGPLTIPPFSFDNSLSLYFCPDVANGATYSGQLVITSNNASSPNNYNLSGTEATPPEIGTAPYGDGDTWTFQATTNPDCWEDPIPLTISNVGISDLTLQGVSLTIGADFNVINSPINVVLGPSETYDLRVEFCPSTTGGSLLEDDLFINHNAANPPPNPIVIHLAGIGN